MNAREMMYEAEIIYESIASQDARGYEPREWSVLLTQAQENIVKNICRLGIDVNELNRRKIGKLLKFITISEGFAEVTNFKNAWGISSAQFPADYFYRASGRCDTAVLEDVRLSPIEYGSYDINIDNPFKNPYNKMFWLITNEDEHIIITHGPTPVAYKMEYVRKPLPIIVEELESDETIDGVTAQTDCELSSIVHRDIVKEAARLAYAYLKDQAGYQIQTAEKMGTPLRVDDNRN